MVRRELSGDALARAGFPVFATLFSVLIFALSPVNIETLGWSVQWSSVLATSFLLIGMWWLEKNRDYLEGVSWRVHLPLFLFATASACSFSRGVLTGAVLGLGFLLPIMLGFAPRLIPKRLPGFLLCLLPAVAVAIVIKMGSSGNHQDMAGHWGDIMEFGASYFLLNPALIATLPFAGVILSASLSRIPSLKPRRLISMGVTVLIVGYCLWGWPATLTQFTDWRGTAVRQLLAEPATNDPNVTVPTMEFMHIERAKALQRAYNLH